MISLFKYRIGLEIHQIFRYKFLLPLHWVILFILVLTVSSCGNDFKRLDENISYKIFPQSTESLPSEGQYIYYHYSVHAADTTIFDSRDQNEPQKFRIPEVDRYKNNDNPVIKMMQFLSSEDSAVVKYNLNKDTKYPKEFEGLQNVEYRIKILEIIDEAVYMKRQSDKRNEQLQNRQSYFEQKQDILDKITPILNAAMNAPRQFIELNDGIKYILVNNSGEGKPTRMDVEEKEKINKNIKFSYILFNETGEYLYSSYENREPYSFQVGSKQVLPAWNIIGANFQQGDEIIAFIPPEQGYGTAGFNGNIHIPPNSYLYCYIFIE